MRDAHIESLQRKREEIKRHIHEECCHAACDEHKVRELKKVNLHLKEEIVRSYK